MRLGALAPYWCFCILNWICLCRIALGGGQVLTTDACTNPLLFEEPGIRREQSSYHPSAGLTPSVQIDLKLCPQFNHRTSCCSPAVEASALTLRFFAWRRWLWAHLEATTRAAQRLAALESRSSGVFLLASQTELQRFRELLRTLAALNGNAGRSCFKAVLQYAAGFLCSACEPNWKGYVGNFAIAREVSDGNALWSFCEDYGRRAMAADAALFQAQRWAQLALGGWRVLHGDLVPFLGPNKLRWTLHANLTPSLLNRTSSTAVGAQAPVAGPTFDAMQEGMRSGFDCTWPPPNLDLPSLPDRKTLDYDVAKSPPSLSSVIVGVIVVVMLCAACVFPLWRIKNRTRERGSVSESDASGSDAGLE